MDQPTPKKRRPAGGPISPEAQTQIRAIVAATSEREAMARLNISKQTLWRALAGLNLAPGSLALIGNALKSEGGAQ